MSGFVLEAEAGAWSAGGLDMDALAASVWQAMSRHCPDLAPREVTVLLADDARMQALNAQFRGKDAPTNVLAFPAPGWPAGVPAEDTSLGDLALGYETVTREARESGKTVRHHVMHLLIHGVLHLLGHDHQDEEEAARMESLEIGILDTLGIANPYEPQTGSPEHTDEPHTAAGS